MELMIPPGRLDRPIDHETDHVAPADAEITGRTGGPSMILPTGATVAVADRETIRLFHNTGVKPGVHLVEIMALRLRRPTQARVHGITPALPTPMAGGLAGRFRGSDGRVSEQAQFGRDH